jgi:predicted esterase
MDIASKGMNGLRLGVAALAAGVLFATTTFAQAPAVGGPGARVGGAPAARGPMTMTPDPRSQQRTYDFKDTSEKLGFVVFVSSKVSKTKKNPLVIALHGLGGDANFLVRDKLIDEAEAGGYIVAGPLGYNVSGWYGSPPIAMGGGGITPPNLAELSEKDVMNVLEMMRKEFNVDPDRTYLMGHSMGGAGTLFLGQKYVTQWAAIAAIAPAAFMMQPNAAQILAPMKKANLPVMIVQGDADNVVPPTNTRAWVDALKQAGMEYKYIEIPGGDHGTVIGDGMADIFKWFAAHPRRH